MTRTEISYPFTKVSFPPPFSPPWTLEAIILLSAFVALTILDSTDK